MKITTLTLSPQTSQTGEVLDHMRRDPPCFVALHHRSAALPDGFLQALSRAVPTLHVASSCRGIMSDQGMADIGMFVLHDPAGDYGSACATFGDDVVRTAQTTTERALSQAGRDGEAPDLVWLSCTPGCEEQALAGIEAALGPNVPIIGGSAADDTIEGGWSVSDGETTTHEGLIVSVLFCSTPLQFAYQNGYAPTQSKGVVTRAEGRKIYEIDDRPANEVYRDWSQRQVPTAEDATVNILSQATLWPLGQKTGAIVGVNSYLLAHPSASHPGGAIELFAEVPEGQEVTQMVGDRSTLAARAGRVAAFSLKAGQKTPNDVAGALVVYCAGCRMAVEDLMSDVQTGVATALGARPFLGVFTFGEQGPLHGKGNCHGNLMISCIAFTQEG